MLTQNQLPFRVQHSNCPGSNYRYQSTTTKYQFFQEFHCERSEESGLTLTSLAMLLSECPRLAAVSDIQAWRGIEPAEVGAL